MRVDELQVYARLPVQVARAEGVELVLADGRRVLDLYGGHCVNTLGAGDAGLRGRIDEQWQRLSFATNLVELDARATFLAAFEPNLPAGDWSVFCSNSGAEANENALKLAIGASGRSRVVCFEGAFHGRTAAAAAVTGLGSYPWPNTPFDVVRVPFGDTGAATSAIDAGTACVILEPIESLAGVVDPPPGFLAALRSACDAVGALLVFDEVQTGNGRLGRPWAAQHFDVIPDVFTTAKGAAGGLPIGLTVARTACTQDLPKGLFGSTFGGGPVPLVAAAEVAARVSSPGFLDAVRTTSAALRDAAARSSLVHGVRGAGLLLGLELAPGLTARAVRDALLERDILVGTCHDPAVVRLSPPLTLSTGDVARFADALESLELQEVQA